MPGRSPAGGSRTSTVVAYSLTLALNQFSDTGYSLTLVTLPSSSTPGSPSISIVAGMSALIRSMRDSATLATTCICLGSGKADDDALFVDHGALLDLILGAAPIVLLVVVDHLAGHGRVDDALGDLIVEHFELLPFERQLGFVAI